ncbi:MAG: DUF4440 domain-containing protein [Phycisphaerales bacterium JB043]
MVARRRISVILPALIATLLVASLSGCARRDRYKFALDDIDRLERSAMAEIVTLHEFFEDWFRGRVPDTNDAFARFSTCMHEDFQLVDPSGGVTNRAQALEIFRPLHGADPQASNSVENIRVVSRQGNTVVCTYTTRSNVMGQHHEYISTAVFTHDRWAPNNVVWVALHETYLAIDE